jgi:hypothetical protein
VKALLREILEFTVGVFAIVLVLVLAVIWH